MKTKSLWGVGRVNVLMAAVFGLALMASSNAVAKRGDGQVIQQNGKSSIALVTQAYKTGKIDKEEFLILKAQAIFAPDKLPLEYRGQREIIKSLTPFLLEIHKSWEDLSEEAKVKLEPLLLRPTDPDTRFLGLIWPILSLKLRHMIPQISAYIMSHPQTMLQTSPTLTQMVWLIT